MDEHSSPGRSIILTLSISLLAALATACPGGEEPSGSSQTATATAQQPADAAGDEAETPARGGPGVAAPSGRGAAGAPSTPADGQPAAEPAAAAAAGSGQQWWAEGCDPHRQGYTTQRGPDAPRLAWTCDTGLTLCRRLALSPTGDLLVAATAAPDLSEQLPPEQVCIVEHVKPARAGALIAIGTDGTERWRLPASGNLSFTVALAPTPRIFLTSGSCRLHSVTSRGGVTYDLAELAGRLRGVEPAGEVSWELDVEGFVVSEPLSTGDGRVVLTALNSEFGERDEYGVQARLWCVHSDGRSAWTRLLPDVKARRDELNSVIATMGTGLTSACQPVLTRQGWLAFGWNDEQYYRFSLEGSRDWEYAFLSRPDCAPAVSPNGNIIVLANDRPHLDERQLELINREAMNSYGILHTLKESGTQRWDWQVGSDVHTAAAIDMDGGILFGATLYEDRRGLERSFGRVYAFQADKKPRWQYDLRSAFDDHPLAPDPLIDAAGVLYIADGGKHLYALNPDGTLKWEYETAGGFATNPVIDPDGMLYIGGRDGRLYALADEGDA